MKDLDENRFYVERYLLRLVVQTDRKQISNATGIKREHSFILNTNRSGKSKYFGKEEIDKFIPVSFFPNALERSEPFLTDLFEMVTFGNKSPIERKTAKSLKKNSLKVSFDERNKVNVENTIYFIMQQISLGLNVHTKHNNLNIALK